MMRWASGWVILVCPAAAMMGWAGIYRPQDSAEKPLNSSQPLSIRGFRDQLGLLATLPALPIDHSTKSKCAEQRNLLEQRMKRGSATVDDQIDLAGLYLRLGEIARANELLRSDPTLTRMDHLAAAMLATCRADEGDYAEASAFLSQALTGWPVERRPYSREELAWCKQVEEYALRLYRGRAREQVRRQPPVGLDDLFGVRFALDDGTYGAGRISAAEWKKLPPDALLIVAQLLVWMPQDNRLYWQFGELLNASGDGPAALGVFEDCMWARRFDAPELRNHRLVLQESTRAVTAVLPKTEIVASSDIAAEAPGWRLDRRWIMGVGIVAAILVAYLAYQQFRQARWCRSRSSG